MILRPRPYQDRGIDDCQTAFELGHQRILYVLPTGGGKTVIFVKIAELASAVGTRTCIIVHRENLLNQAAKKLREVGIPYSIIAPGHSFFGDKVCVASVDTLVRRLGRYPFELLIPDEGHHAVSPKYQKVFAAYPDAHVLGVTATPERLDGTGLKAVYQKMVLGPSIRQLIDDGYLVEPVAFGPKKALNLNNVHTVAGDYNLRELAEAMDKSTVTGDAVEHYRQLSHGKPAILFAVNVKHAEDAAAEFRAAGYRAASVDGVTMSKQEAARRIRGLADGSLDVLTSCDLVSEGTDVPGIATVIGLRPTKSLALYLQQVGRGLRPVYAPGFDLSTREGRLAAIAASDKPHAVVLDHAGNTLRFGFADDEREWTLEGKVRRGSGANNIANLQVRQCPSCYRCHKAGVPACPNCGHAYAVDVEAGPDVEDGQLVQIDKEALRRARSEMIRKARTFKELKDVAKKLGYQPQWAWRTYLQRGGDPALA